MNSAKEETNEHQHQRYPQDPSLFREANYIDGQWLPAKAGHAIAIHNPANGELVGHVPAFGAEETARAIAAARRRCPPGVR